MRITSDLLLFLALAFAIGVALSTQTALNSQLRTYLNSPLQTAFFSFLVGTVVLAALVFSQGVEKPSLSQLMQIPWFLWLGGLLGVYAVSISIYTAPRLGLLTLSGLIIFGQLTMSMLLDHHGWFGVHQIHVNWKRLLGALIIFIGVLLTLQR